MEFNKVAMKLAICITFLLVIICQSASSQTGTTYQFSLVKTLTTRDVINAISLSPDDHLIASGTDKGEIKMWDMDSGKQLKTLMRHVSAVRSISFSPDSNMIACGTASGEITLWDVNYKEKIRRLKGHKGEVKSLQFTADGRLLISSSADGSIVVWDMKDGKEDKRITGHSSSVNSISLFNGTVVSGSSDMNIAIWDLNSGKQILKAVKGSAVNVTAVSKVKRQLAVGLSDGIVELINMDLGEKIADIKMDGPINCLTFSPDGRLLMICHSDSVTAWEVDSKGIATEFKTEQKKINSITFSHDGKSFVSGGLDGTIKIWKVVTTESLSVKLKSTFSGWLRGTLELSAETIGTPDSVKFQYSLDGLNWSDIVELKTPPYTITWDTKQTFPSVAKDVTLRVIAERSPGISATDIAKDTFNVDNEAPIITDDYDDRWHTTDFTVTLNANDGEGIGISNIYYRLNYGNEMNILKHGQPLITEDGINMLEYWGVDKLGNAGQHRAISVKLDKTAPVFLEWSKSPQTFSDDYDGPVRIYVKIVDGNGSGIDGNVQFSYHFGSGYPDYKDMTRADENTWYYDIPPPEGGWKQYKDKRIFYRAKCKDSAGNIAEVSERQDMLGIAKTPPVITLLRGPRTWESGEISIEADVHSLGSQVMSVKFDYTTDGIRWSQIAELKGQPYLIRWDSKKDIKDVAKRVRIRITAIDSDGLSSRYETQDFGIDNQPPNTSHDYDGKWHKADFNVNLVANDMDGSGVIEIRYRLNNGFEKTVTKNGQPKIDEQGLSVLEYWSIDAAGNEEQHKILKEIKLDRLPPYVERWDIIREEDHLKVIITASDPDSGISMPPEIDYYFDLGQFSGYKEMTKLDNENWQYIIKDDQIVGAERLYLKVSLRDNANNLSIRTWEYEMGGSKVAEETATTPEISREFTHTNKQTSKIVWDGDIPNRVKIGSEIFVKGHIDGKITTPVPLNLKVISPKNVIYVSQIYTDQKGAFSFTVTLDSEGEWSIITSSETDLSDTIKVQALPEGSKVRSQQDDRKKNLFRAKLSIIGFLIVYTFIVAFYR